MDFHGKATSDISHWEIQFLGKETVHYEFVTDCDNKLCVTVRQAQLGKEGAERISRATKLGENRINEDINHYWHWQTSQATLGIMKTGNKMDRLTHGH